MKKITMVLLILCIMVTGSLFAMDQGLKAGVVAHTVDLLEPDDLVFNLIPVLEYKFGNTVDNAFTGYVYTELPYTIGDAFDTLFPYAQVGVDYRIRTSTDAPFFNIGLDTAFYQTQQPNTMVSALAYFYWYPYNQAKEHILHKRLEPWIDGIRFGFGFDAGTNLNNLFETADVVADLNGAVVGSLSFGSSLSNHIWFYSNTKVTLPNAQFTLTPFTYTLGADAITNVQLAYVGKSLQMSAGVRGSFSLDKIYTDAGFFKEHTYTYRFTLYTEVDYFIMPRLLVYGGAGFSGTRGSLDEDLYAYVSISYYLI